MHAPDAVAAAVEDAGGEVEDERVVLARTISAEGRSRAFVGGASVPVSTLASVTEPLVAVHGQSDQHRLLRPQAQRDALDRFGGAVIDDLRGRLHPACTPLSRTPSASSTELTTSARERAREADLLRFGLDEIEAVSPQPGEDTDARVGGGPARLRRHAAHRRRAGPRGAVERGGQPGRAGHDRGGADPARERPRARPRGGRARRPAGRADLPALRPGRRRRVLRQPARDRPEPARRGLRAPRRTDRADPQVRRHHRRGARLGRGLAPPASGASTTPTTASPSCASGARACAPSSPPWARACRRRVPRRPSGWPTRSSRSSRPWRCRTPGCRSPSPSARCRPTTPRPGSSRCTAAGCGTPPAASTRSSCCWPPTPAPSPGRSTRAPPAASCPG